MTIKGNAIIGQSGGPTSVINQTLIGVAKEALKAENIETVYGAIHGIKGILAEELYDFSNETEENLEKVAITPSSALLSVRLKPTKEICANILEKFKKLNIRYFFYIGGNDTAETTHIINEMAKEDNYELRCFHCPKTIDNDLRVTDHCPGFGSAAKWVASAFMGDNLDNRSLGGIKINIVMGRDAGWLTAAAALARVFEGDGPHLIYLPENDFYMDKFIDDVIAIYKKTGRCVLAISEGIHGPNNTPIIDLGEVDSHGNRQLSGSGALGDFLSDKLKAALKERVPETNHRIRADTFGYLQRCFPGVISETDSKEARMAGKAAVIAATTGEDSSGSIAFKRLDGEYKIETFVTPLSTVAKDTKEMPNDFINGNDITKKFIEYVKPLAGEIPVIGQLGF